MNPINKIRILYEHFDISLNFLKNIFIISIIMSYELKFTIFSYYFIFWWTNYIDLTDISMSNNDYIPTNYFNNTFLIDFKSKLKGISKKCF